MSVDSLPRLRKTVLAHRKGINIITPREGPETVECRIAANVILNGVNNDPIQVVVSMHGSSINLRIQNDPYNMSALDRLLTRMETGLKIGGMPRLFRSIEMEMAELWGVKEEQNAK